MSANTANQLKANGIPMSQNPTAVKKELDRLIEDAQALLHATAGAAEQNVIEARARLAAALKKGEGIWRRARHTAVQSAEDADQAIREHPYHSLGVALGVGIILGFLASRRW